MREPKTIAERCPTCGQQRDRWNGAYLRELREANGLSLREVARRAGLSAPFVSDVELNRRNPSLALLNVYRGLLYSKVGPEVTEGTKDAGRGKARRARKR